jgi:FemAB-related protein (PEP-CTERM system-associated)
MLSEHDKQRWDKFVSTSDVSTCYHQSGWKDVVEKAFGHPTYYLMSEDSSGSIDGILPLVHMRSFIFGNFLSSMPFFNYGGFCAANRSIVDRLLTDAREVARETGADYIEFRHEHNLLDELPAKTTKASMRLLVPSDSTELFKSFPSKLRSQIRRAQKEGLTVTIGRSEELANFYSVFSENMRDLGTPVYGMSFFQTILDTFPDSTWICTVSTRDGMPIASGFLVGFKQILEIPWASSLRKFNVLGSNMLLYWSVLEFCCNQGFRVFDFGRSSIGEGTYRFKEQWGARPTTLYWHYWMGKDGNLPQLNPNNPKFELAIRVWKHLPVRVTRVIGPRLVKYLP